MINRKGKLPEEPFDPDADPLLEADELNFTDDEEQSFTSLSPETDSTEAEMLEIATARPRGNKDEAKEDNLEPEVLIKEDGARSPRESSADIAADQSLTLVGIEDIGAGKGLDEAELARVKPLDGKP